MTEEIKLNSEEIVSVETEGFVEPEIVMEPSVGEVLRTAREVAGLRIEDIAERFKLRVAQVQAVEANEWEKLPSRTFARGLVRGYARELRLDSDALTNRVMPEVKVAESPIVPPSTQNLQPSKPSESTNRDLVMVVLGGVILLVSVLAYFLWPSADNDHAPILPPPSTEVPAAVSTVPSAQELPSGVIPQPLTPNVVPLAAPAPIQPTTATASTVVATPAVITNPNNASTPASAPIKITFTGQSWVEIKDKNGNVVYSQTGTAGLEKEVSGLAPFTFHIGNVSGVAIKYKGQLVDLKPYTNNNVGRMKLD
jgi:cytoskeleton protein RodZ